MKTSTIIGVNLKNGILTKFLVRSALGYTYVSLIHFLRPIIVDVFIANTYDGEKTKP